MKAIRPTHECGVPARLILVCVLGCTELLSGTSSAHAGLLAFIAPAQAGGQSAPTSTQGGATLENRGARACKLPQQPPYQGRSLWNANLWPSGTVPYVFDANTTPTNRTAMRQAMDVLEAVTNVHFVARTNQGNYLHILDADSNYSYVGMIGGGQNVGVYNWNYRFIMCHELMHALGVWHEQSRPDRDQYITVNYANIQDDWESQYAIQDGAIHGPYDFDSVMHYGDCDASVCCPAASTCACPQNCWTMTALPEYATFQSLMGQRSHLSDGDKAGLASRYGEPPCPTFSDQPDSTVVGYGQTATFSAWAVGAGTPTYRWRRGGANLADDGRISGSGTATLTISNATATDAGTYDCVATNTCGSTASEPATLNVTCVGAWSQAGVGGVPARIAGTLAFDSARGVAVLLGGVAADGATILKDTWEWDGNSWSQRAPIGHQRYIHAAAYDSARGRTVVFGGGFTDGNSNTLVLGDTWEWDGTVWTQRSSTGPAPRWAHSMVYDSARGVTVLFGGNNAHGGWFADTWEWDGSTWTQRSGPAPGARAGHGMTYDSARSVTVLFGGSPAGGGPFLADTWELGSGGWTQRTGGAPPARSGGTMAFDSVRGVCVLFGGCNAPGSGTCMMSDTWEWNGAAWSRTSPPGPSARNYHAMAYDTWRSVTLVAAGYDGGPYRNDIWEQRSVPSIREQPQSTTACNGAAVSFNVAALSAVTPSFQWQRNGVDIPDATGSELILNSVSQTDAGAYTCTVSNPCGSVTSIPAVLAICGADFDCNGFVNGEDFDQYVSVFETGEESADFDQDGFLTGVDFDLFVRAFESGC